MHSYSPSSVAFSHTIIDNSFLDWFNKSTDSAHPVFGKIVENYSLVQQISKAPSRNDNPITPIKMISVRVQ
jgi:cyclophilin family peptidyl-prolyl cis-trans isomerase